MSVQVLGVMVSMIVVNGPNGNSMPAEGRPVRLTLTEQTKRGATPELRKCDSMRIVTWPDFDAAARNAFSRWSCGRGDVVWKLEACDDQGLPELKGPSLSGAFAVGLTLLHYRPTEAQSKPVQETQASFLHSDFSNVAVSAEVLCPMTSLEAIRLGAVGKIDRKARALAVRGLAGCALMVSKRQDDIDTENGVTILKVDTVEQAISEVFRRQAWNILQTL